MKNPLFNIIKKLYSQSFNGLPVSLKKTKATKTEASKNYYLIELERTTATFALRGEEVSISDQHISIYELQAKNEAKGLSAIHYTANCQSPHRRRYIVHVYFDRYGNYVETQVKDVQAGVRINIDEAEFKSHAILASGLLVNQLSIQCQQESEELFEMYTKMEARACALSRDIDFSSLDMNQRPIKEYMICIRTCINLQEKLNAFSFEPSVTLIDLLKNIIKSIGRMQKEQAEVKREVADEEEQQEKVANQSDIADVQMRNIKKRRLEQKRQVDDRRASQIQAYINELETLSESGDYVQVIMRKHEIYHQLTILYEDDVDAITRTIQSISENLNAAQQALYRCFENDDLAGAQRLATLPKINIPFQVCFQLATRKQTALLAFCLERFNINVNTYEPEYLPDSHCLIAIAVKNADSSTFNMLLSKGADPNTFFPISGRSLLMECCANRQISFVKTLLGYSAQVNAHEEYREFILPVRTNNAIRLNQLQRLLKNRKIQGNTALSIACQCEDERLTRLLLASGADVNATDSLDFSALASCAMKEESTFSEACLDVLLEYGANINRLEGSKGNQTTLLSFNVMKRRFHDVKALLHRNANPNQNACMTKDIIPGADIQHFGHYRLPKQLTPLHLALLKDYHEIFDYFMNHTNISSANKRSAKYIAIILGRKEYFQALNIREDEAIADSDTLSISSMVSTEDEYWLNIA